MLVCQNRFVNWTVGATYAYHVICQVDLTLSSLPMHGRLASLCTTILVCAGQQTLRVLAFYCIPLCMHKLCLPEHQRPTQVNQHLISNSVAWLSKECVPMLA